MYHNTLDFPDQYVARRFELDNPSSDHFAHTDKKLVENWIYEEAEKFNQGKPVKVQRSPNDDPAILEVWL